jgi:hypothetical protein
MSRYRGPTVPFAGRNLKVRFCEEWDAGFGWIASEPPLLERASHAVLLDGRVFVFDPVYCPEVEERIRALGEPAAVVQLLDRHERDGPAIAERLGVPLHRVPADGVPGAPFEVIPLVRLPRWREVAVWAPTEGVLVCADALGTASYFLAPGDRLAVHPLLRTIPPRALSRARALRHVLCGHGAGVHGDEAPAALAEALTTARRRIPRYAIGLLARRSDERRSRTR